MLITNFLHTAPCTGLLLFGLFCIGKSGRVKHSENTASNIPWLDTPAAASVFLAEPSTVKVVLAIGGVGNTVNHDERMVAAVELAAADMAAMGERFGRTDALFARTKSAAVATYLNITGEEAELGGRGCLVMFKSFDEHRVVLQRRLDRLPPSGPARDG